MSDINIVINGIYQDIRTATAGNRKERMVRAKKELEDLVRLISVRRYPEKEKHKQKIIKMLETWKERYPKPFEEVFLEKYVEKLPEGKRVIRKRAGLKGRVQRAGALVNLEKRTSLAFPRVALFERPKIKPEPKPIPEPKVKQLEPQVASLLKKKIKEEAEELHNIKITGEKGLRKMENIKKELTERINEVCTAGTEAEEICKESREFIEALEIDIQKLKELLNKKSIQVSQYMEYENKIKEIIDLIPNAEDYYENFMAKLKSFGIKKLEKIPVEEGFHIISGDIETFILPSDFPDLVPIIKEMNGILVDFDNKIIINRKEKGYEKSKKIGKEEIKKFVELVGKLNKKMKEIGFKQKSEENKRRTKTYILQQLLALNNLSNILDRTELIDINYFIGEVQRAGARRRGPARVGP